MTIGTVSPARRALEIVVVFTLSFPQFAQKPKNIRFSLTTPHLFSEENKSSPQMNFLDKVAESFPQMTCCDVSSRVAGIFFFAVWVPIGIQSWLVNLPPQTDPPQK